MVDLQRLRRGTVRRYRYSLLEKMVDLQPRRRPPSRYRDTVYSKKWSICNAEGADKRVQPDTVYSKKWSICNAIYDLELDE